MRVKGSLRVHGLAVAAVVALVLVAAAADASAQSTRSQLDRAQRRVAGVRSKITQIASEYERQSVALNQTNVRISRTRTDMKRTESELGSLNEELKARVRRAYRDGGGLGFFEFLLEARSFRDFSVRFITMQRQSLSDEDLILKLRKKRAELEAKEEALRREREIRADQVAATKAQARRLQISFNEARALEREFAGRLRREEVNKLFAVGGRAGGGIRFSLDFCPVAGPHAFSNDWGAPRGGGTRRHKGNDILSAMGTPIVAPVSGTVTSWRTGGLGGIAMYLWGSDNNEYYFAHNSRNIAPAGRKVAAGQTIAAVGNTGNARGGPPHLHFEIHPGGGGAVNPYPSLVGVC